MEHWDCDYCRSRMAWNAGERIPAKCISCGAPHRAPARFRDSGPSIPISVIFGGPVMCRPSVHARIICE